MSLRERRLTLAIVDTLHTRPRRTMLTLNEAATVLRIRAAILYQRLGDLPAGICDREHDGLLLDADRLKAWMSGRPYEREIAARLERERESAARRAGR